MAKKGNLYQLQSRNKEAIKALSICLTITDSLGFKEIAKDSHLAIADILFLNQQYAEAYTHSQMALRLSEDLFQEANQKNMTEAEFKYSVQNKDAEIAYQKKALTVSKWVRTIFGLLSLALLILLFFSWKQVKAKQQAIQNTKTLLKELHHRVKNNMQTIASMMRLQARKADPSVSAVLMENKSRLEIFSLLHQDLYLNDNVEKLDLRPFIVNLIEKFKFLYNINDEKLQTHVEVIDKGLDVETALSIGLILNELVTNSFKYAKPTLSTLTISIKICQNYCHYADNGQSLPNDFDFDKNEGFGMRLISYFAQQIHAKYQFYVDNGVHFHLTFG